MIGRLALPEGDDQRPAVLIAHEGGGLDDYQKGRAERFAELGYVAFALDYHGGGKPLADEDEIMARCQALWNEPDRIRALAGAGLQVLLYRDERIVGAHTHQHLSPDVGGVLRTPGG
ncbi:MAG TPA: dienelactone hydrolase family protein, partial [Candidatus Binatia bacterium]|nr:dienelactone hydrolase family protein [Candidatus Binatia bacterium]